MSQGRTSASRGGRRALSAVAAIAFLGTATVAFAQTAPTTRAAATLVPGITAVAPATAPPAAAAASRPTTTTIATTAPAVADWNALLTAAAPGDVVRLEGLKLEDVPVLDVEKKVAPGPQFLLSDAPEYFPAGGGIALQEDVKPGAVRLYVYHVPEKEGEHVISAVLENLGEKPMNVRFLRSAFPKPSLNYHAIGKAGLVGYFTSKPQGQVRVVPPKSRVVIDPAMDKTGVKKDELVHGFYELEIDQPGRISVIQRNVDQDSTRAVDELPKLPFETKNAGRGTFSVANYDVLTPEIDTAKGPTQVLVADGKRDPWVTGKDGISGKDVKLAGNYGVMYHMKIRWKSTDGRGVALVMANPRFDNKWCSALAATVVADGKVVALPTKQTNFKVLPEAAVIGTWMPKEKGKEEVIDLIYSPPGASCLPTPIVIVPVTK